MSHPKGWGSMVLNRQFWLGMAGMASTTLILYDWYNDRYSTPLERYNRIEQDYILPIKQIYKIRNAFIKEMVIGLNEKDEISSDPKLRKSSLKMLASKIWTIPSGAETGTYYTLDWGGSNYRVLRITFSGRNKKSESKQLTEKISREYMTINDANALFDHLTVNLKKLMKETKDRPKSPQHSPVPESSLNIGGSGLSPFSLLDDSKDDPNKSNNNNNNNNANKQKPNTNKNKNNTNNSLTTNNINKNKKLLGSGDDNKSDAADSQQQQNQLSQAINWPTTQSMALPPPLDFPTGVQGYTHFGNTQRMFEPDSEFPIGFCFSFPMRQPALDQGILVEWTKGFAVPGVVGRNVTSMMHEAFARSNINAKIESVVNDTVGTLLACAYDNDNTRIGLILGTGSNAAYVEPERNNEIINIEWGNFNKLLPRVPPDWIMDEHTPNTGSYFAEKMISGMYLGELSRLLAIEVFREAITDYGEESILNLKWGFGAHLVSQILEWYFIDKFDKILNFLKQECGLKNFNKSDAKIFGSVCKLIVYRSADFATTLLTAVLEKTGLYYTVRADERNPFEQDQFILNEKYKNNDSMYVTVGIDGSVYHKCSGYAERIRDTLERILGREIADKVFMVHSEDGSGKGAALAAAGAKVNILQNKRQSAIDRLKFIKENKENK